MRPRPFFLGAAVCLPRLEQKYGPRAACTANVTQYVQEEFNRADALESEGRKGTIGFALTILQRRLASSPEAIYQSLKRRRERLERRLAETELLSRGAVVPLSAAEAVSPDDLADLEEAPAEEVEQVEEELVDQATAVRTVAELRVEIGRVHVDGPRRR